MNMSKLLAAAGIAFGLGVGTSADVYAHGREAPSAYDPCGWHSGWHMGHMMGRGMMGQQGQMPMMGHGMMGQGMMGQGMMGQGMMGQGMMGQQGHMPMMGYGMMHPHDRMPTMDQGMGQGMGHGRAGQDRGHGMLPPLRQDLSAEDVTHMMEHRLAREGNPNLKLGKVEAKDDDTVIAEIVTQDGSLVDRLAVDRHTGQMRRAK